MPPTDQQPREPGRGDEIVPFVQGEAPWQLAGAEIPAALEAPEAEPGPPPAED